MLDASVSWHLVCEGAEIVDITLTAIYQEAEDGGYVGYIAELPGANTQGETIGEVRENLLEAMQMVLETNREEAERRFGDNPKMTREQLKPHAS